MKKFAKKLFTVLISSALLINFIACDSHSEAPINNVPSKTPNTQEHLDKENEAIPVSIICSNSLLNKMGVYTTDISINVTNFQISYCTVSTDYGFLSNDVSNNQKSLQMSITPKLTVTYSLQENGSLPEFDYNRINFEFYGQDRNLIYKTCLSVLKMDDGKTYSVREESYSGNDNYGEKVGITPLAIKEIAFTK